MPDDRVTYYVCDVVTGIVLDTLPVAGEVAKTRGEVESASWDLAVTDERVSSPTYTEVQGPELTPEVVNRSRNPSVETAGGEASTSTALYGSVVYDSTVASSGTRSVRTTRTTDTPSNNISVIRLTPTAQTSPYNVPMTEGETVSLGMDARCSRSPARARFQYAFKNAANSTIGGFLFSDYVDLPAANQWHRLTWPNITAPAGTTALEVRGQVAMPQGQNTVGGEVGWFDSLTIVDGPAAADYFDGDSPGCDWDGAPHASTSRRLPTYDTVRTYSRNDAWATLLQPWKVMIVAEYRGRLIQGWVLVQATYGGPSSVPLQGSTLERLLERVYVRDHDWLNVDLGQTAAEIVEQVLVPAGGWSVEWTPTGTREDTFHLLDAQKTVFEALEELQATEGGPVWMTDVAWIPGQEGRQVEKIVRIGKTLGRPKPNVVFRAQPGDYTRLVDWSGDGAALEVWAATEGSGGLGYTAESYRSSKLDAGWHPAEAFVQFTDLDDFQLRRRRDRRGRELEDGLTTWEATLRIDGQPILGAEWNIGDTVTLEAPPGAFDPSGGSITAEVHGWALDTTAGTIVPRLVQEADEQEAEQ